ncbi:hypothetical protein LCM23_13325 [Cytobacillus kochii]|uniref:hypothetical protein n=1 Tax=Cytobacillus kochii TaxID=859143 RepID=UPI001CD244F2|nr:hypothetical protein [Cytobacillus kochii]MCA1027077.1 hypothetical protein [Cytobacillus kochii]
MTRYEVLKEELFLINELLETIKDKQKQLRIPYAEESELVKEEIKLLKEKKSLIEKMKLELKSY